MSLYPLSVKPILKTINMKDHQKNNTFRPTEKKSTNLTPGPFCLYNVQSVPSSFFDIVEWLTTVKPALFGPHFSDLISHSFCSYSPYRLYYNPNEVKKRFEEWTRLMEDKTRNLINVIDDKTTLISGIDKRPKKTDKSKTFTVYLEETPTITLLFLKTRAAVKGSIKGNEFEIENKSHQNNEFGIKKFTNESTQTLSSFGINRSCGGNQKTFHDKGTATSESDIIDINNLFCNIAKMTDSPRTKKAKKFHRKKLGKTRVHFNIDDLEESDDDELSEARKIADTVESEEFFKVSMLMNRILERNINPQLKIDIKNAPKCNPLADKVEIKCQIFFIQRVSFHKVWCLPVTSISINESNRNLFAVGHGKLFSDQPNYLGRVNLWNLKSLSAPEKTMDFKSGVTSVSFSRLSPYALLISFLSGHIAVINISQRTPMYIINEENNPSNFSPVWQACWFYNGINSEIIVTCGGDGLINGYYAKTLEKILIASLIQETDIEGIDLPCSKVRNEKIIVKPNVYCIASSFKYTFKYLAGTEDGSIHEFSTEFKHKLDSFQGHHGPVHQIKYHPDTHDVFFSVGIDFCLRIWVRKIKEPIITLTVSNAHIEGADWSPTHPTIIAAVADCILSIWDIRVSTTDPWVSFKSPTCSKFTTVEFLSGNTIMCGDIYGDILFMGLRDLPFVPTSKAEALGTCIFRLISDTHLAELLRKSGFSFFIEEKNDLFFNL